MSGVLRLRLAFSLIGAILVAGIVGGLAYSSNVKTAPAAGGVYVEGLTGQPEFLNPLLAATTDYPAQSIDALVFSGLVKEDPSGQPRPDLASSWTISPDGKQYTFYLRPDAQWQDGQPVTADDVLYTVATIQAPDFPGDADLAAAWKGVQAAKLDSLTVQLTRSTAFAPFLDYASVGLLPAHLLGQVAPKDLPGSAFNRLPVGSGPYRLRQLDLHTATLDVSDRYYGDRPYISQIVFRFYKDDASVAQALLRGEVQGDWHVDAAQAAALRSDTSVSLYRAAQPSFSGLCFNLADPLLGQLPVRQAIAYGIDRDALAEHDLGGLAELADGPIASGSWAFDATTQRYRYDPAQAQGILDKAGWLPGPDGVRVKDGRRLTPVILTANLPDHVALADGIAQQLKSIGIDANVQAVGFDGLVKDFLAPRRFALALLDWDVPGGDPDPYALWHSSQAAPDGLNFSGWKNPRADAQLEIGRNSTDLAAREQAYDQFQAIFAADLPAFPLFHPVYQYAIDDRVQGVSLPATVQPWERFQTEAQWYLNTKTVSPIFGG